MSEIRWTDAQRQAIDARGDILVSAAAGSGKTAVLVQRVIEMISSECDIDSMLIVTFTRSAAAQMREKISEAIAEKIAENPLDGRFRRQQLLLGKAQITTIDAFCAEVVKSHFQLLSEWNISMNYKTLDAAEMAVLSSEVLDEVLDEFYEQGDSAFKELMDVFTSGKNDLNIYNIINTLHNYTSAFVSREAWMHEKTALYTVSKVRDSLWGKLLLGAIGEGLTLAHDYIQKAIEIVAEDEATDAVYGDIFRADEAVITAAAEAVKGGDWDSLFTLRSHRFSRYSAVKKGIDTELRAAAKPFRDAATGAFKAALANVVESESDFERDNALIYPVAAELEKLFERYEQRLFETKCERQSFEFSDISYLALKVLCDENNMPTPAALEYREAYKAILIDEYQDTNDVQDLIFSTIENHNLFVVGDVKQSIYRFRQAMPEIFIGRRKRLQPYREGADSGYILLKNNFRSEKPITDFVNFLFKKIMSESLGDVDYNEDEYLIPGGEAGDAEAAAPELHLLENLHLEEREKLKDSEYEAHYIAAYIRAQVESGAVLKIGKEQRAVTYSDFCILLRSKTHMAELENILRARGIPCRSVVGESLFETAEISLVMSFLRAIDNPLRDVDLIAVMYSEICGFSAQELALIRMAKRKGSLYTAVHALAAQGNGKCRAFLEQLEHYRTLAATHEPAEFLRCLYRESMLPELVSAGENGAVKKANLLKFISVVELYAAGGYYGLTGLVRFLEKVKANNPDITCAFVPESESKVQIMTVHASKGLEFPVVIFAYTNNNNNHYGSNIVLHRDYGIGMKPKYPQQNARYQTISYSAVSLANLRSDMAEEIRTLYVALTRAKAKLVITGTFSGKPKKSGATPREEALSAIAPLSAAANGKIREGWLRANNNYLYWLCACAFMHPSAANLRALNPASSVAVDSEQGSALQVLLPEYYPVQEPPTVTRRTAQANENMVRSMQRAFAFDYPYAGAELIESKKTPSAVAESENRDAAVHFDAPDFLRAQKIGAAGRGTATHRFMEKVRRFGEFDFDKELAFMLEKGFLSPAQAEVLDKKAITAFFNSPLAARMACADRLVREYAIAYLENAAFFYPDLPEKLREEKVFVDGVIDAAFVENGKVHIVDYKTDRVKDSRELSERYAKQMRLYKRALESLWGMEVERCHLYSFCLNEDIVLDF